MLCFCALWCSLAQACPHRFRAVAALAPRWRPLYSAPSTCPKSTRAGDSRSVEAGFYCESALNPRNRTFAAQAAAAGLRAARRRPATSVRNGRGACRQRAVTLCHSVAGGRALLRAAGAAALVGAALLPRGARAQIPACATSMSGASTGNGNSAYAMCVMFASAAGAQSCPQYGTAATAASCALGGCSGCSCVARSGSDNKWYSNNGAANVNYQSSDGNFVVYPPTGLSVWGPGSQAGSGTMVLCLQQDGNFLQYASSGSGSVGPLNIGSSGTSFYFILLDNLGNTYEAVGTVANSSASITGTPRWVHQMVTPWCCPVAGQYYSGYSTSGIYCSSCPAGAALVPAARRQPAGGKRVARRRLRLSQ